MRESTNLGRYLRTVQSTTIYCTCACPLCKEKEDKIIFIRWGTNYGRNKLTVTYYFLDIMRCY